MKLNTIYQGDCLEIMEGFPRREIDLIVTSPPYNVGIDYGVYKDNLTEKKYLDFIESFIKESKRILKEDGRIAIVVPGGIGRNPYIPIGYEILNICKFYFQLRDTIIWYKGLMHGKTAWGSWKSPSNPVLRGMSELIVVAHNEKAKKIDRKKTDLTATEFMIYSNNIWFISPDNRRNSHPATFPEELPYRLIKFYTWIDDIILDPFAGICTTCLAAKRLKRNWIGIELNPEYIEIANKRIKHVQMELL